MTDQTRQALDMIQQQVQALDALLEEARTSLNTVAAGERLVKWKGAAIPLVARHLGQQEAQRFADTKPGPSFSNDLLEELGDDVELYRDYLVALAEKVKKDVSTNHVP
ncbi:MAG: hypothetical protein FJ245_09070 [Nitrospira sp.]|nr:hypothetical protein [Nitrospira sp.]